jgi:DNA (cytosine-5)-methyltransferase 1
MKKVSYRKPAPRAKRTKVLRTKNLRGDALREESSVYISPVRPAFPLKVAEMFAGVGGFRVGLERANKEAKRELFDVVWGNQFEPASTRQHAFEVYHSRWPNNGIHSNQDISLVEVDSVPSMQLLVGGFPCQDYSVARTLNQAAGLVGKKGVLWWEIHRLLRDKHPPFGMFENVDRLLKSPATQRGRDFAVMLASLSDLGYVAEWRVINAAEYGMPTKRLRVFIMAYRNDTAPAQKLLANRADWLVKSGVIAKAFPVEKPLLIPELSFSIKGSLSDITDKFNVESPDASPFANAGLICDRGVLTLKTTPDYNGQRMTLGDILVPEKQVNPSYIIPHDEVKKWKYCKGAKHLTRTKKNGIVYSYDEGPMSFPDPLDRPARTIITAEGGATPSRFKHVVQMSDGRYRRLMPVELERINTFPDNHTKLGDITDTKRAFFMGNALVTEVVTRLGLSLARAIEAP